MPIYTKAGDKGTTSLLGGAVVPKDHPRVEAYGSIDELNAVLGIAISFSESNETTASLKRVQRDLFLIGAALASKGARAKQISPARIGELETEIDLLESALTPLHHFIIPGGSKTASLLHLARSVCRRAERRLVSLSHKEKINPDIPTYLNRLGDLLFMQARSVNYKKRNPETIWKGR